MATVVTAARGEHWALGEAAAVIDNARKRLPEWRIALHGSVLHDAAGRDLDLVVLVPEDADPDDLLTVMGATDVITARPDKRRFWLATRQVVDAKLGVVRRP